MSNDEKKQQEKEQREEEEALQRSAPSGRTVYLAIEGEGRHELDRSSRALAWSGLAAGLSMGFSLISEGLLRAHLAETEWRALVVKLGYSIGFLIVILGRQQLFTENTLTPILPLLKDWSGKTLLNVLRLWGIVLVTNLCGGILIAIVIGKLDVFDQNLLDTMFRIGREAFGKPFFIVMLRAIFAGWLIALMVWLLPYAETQRIWVIIILTYLIGIGHFPHVIAGSIEVFVVAVRGEITWAQAFGSYVLPTLIGNILGGVALVAALSHAQVMAGESK